MRRVRGPVFPLFRHPLAPLSRTGRVVVCVLFAVWAFAMSVAWSPAHADDSQAAPAEGPYFQLRRRRPGARPAAAEVDPGRRAHLRRDRRRHRDAALQERRPARRSRRSTCSPAPPGPPCYGMNVRLGDRLITAKIREKQQARIEYDSAKKEGKTAALLEQHLPNVFQMNVANILPGDDVKVELRYTELLVPHRRATTSSSFPPWSARATTARSPARRRRSWVGQPYLPAGEASAPRFDINGGARHAHRPEGSALALARHRGDAGEGDAAAPTVALQHGSGAANNRDFILRLPAGRRPHRVRA